MSTHEPPADPFEPRPYVESRPPEWARDAVLYQVNTRHFSPEGTLAGVTAQLPRLRDLGVGIVWLMPVHEVGEVARKGRLGSPYAVRDHLSVARDLGTVEDLRALVDRAHELGLRVVLDWVANHTSPDCPLVTEHPDWYRRDEEGALVHPEWWDWDDVVELDYSRPALRRWMTEAMVGWVRDVGVDGFRCDVAGYVPTDFWETARRALEEVKPVFMLAEWESKDLHRRAFDASYAWSWNEALHRLASGQADLGPLLVYYAWAGRHWPQEAMRMTFVSNHDKNAWEGTEYEQFGDALQAAVVLSVVGEGIPLLHNGQEAGHDKRLEFFERDPIPWREHPMGALYQRLFSLKREWSPLWNGAWGARMRPVRTDQQERVLAFVRADDHAAVLGVLNLSPDPVEVTGPGRRAHGAWQVALDARGTPAEPGPDPASPDGALVLDGSSRLALPAWGSLVLVRGEPQGRTGVV